MDVQGRHENGRDLVASRLDDSEGGSAWVLILEASAVRFPNQGPGRVRGSQWPTRIDCSRQRPGGSRALRSLFLGEGGHRRDGPSHRGLRRRSAARRASRLFYGGRPLRPVIRTLQEWCILVKARCVDAKEHVCIYSPPPNSLPQWQFPQPLIDCTCRMPNNCPARST
jgi:hypothetical protein